MGIEKKKTVLEQWRQRQSGARETANQVQALPAEVPLSRGQHRIWTLQQLFPENPFYHYAEVYDFDGELDRERFARAFLKVAERHDILRTTFHFKDGDVVQTAGEEPLIEFSYHSLVGVDKAQVQKLVRSEARRPFDLENGPLTRVVMIKTGSRSHSVLVSMHHIITDKWSMEVLRNELARFYVKPSADPDPLPLQFAEYAFAENPGLEGLDYWRQKLDGAESSILLPNDRARPIRPTFHGAYSESRLPNEVAESVGRFCDHNRVTPYLFFQAVFQVFLSKLSGQDDILVGTPITNRDKVELEPLIGFFNDTVVIRGRPAADTTFLAFLNEMRETVNEAFEYKRVPFESIVNELRPDRVLSQNPLFQVMFIFHKVPGEADFGPGLTMNYQPFDLGVAKFDLTLYVSELKDGLTAIFEYSKDLFGKSTIRRFHKYFLRLLEDILTDPSKPIKSYSLLDEVDVRQLTIDWNQTERPIDERPVHELIIEQAAVTKDAVAVTSDGRTVSYAELIDESEDIAAFLRAEGLNNSAVGLFFPPGPEMIIAMLGILRAGCHYVPIDIEAPAARIGSLLETAGARIVLTAGNPPLDETVLKGRQVIDVSEVPEANFEDKPVPGDSLAYVVYTSGSSGKPKAVGVSHKNLAYSNAARKHFYNESPRSFLLTSAYVFDSSAAGIYWTLTSGGNLVVAGRRAEQDLERLTDTLLSNSVSHTLLLPTLYETMIDNLPAEAIGTLGAVIVAGEACPSGLAEKHLELFPAVGLYNEYGPTETTVWATAHKIGKDDPANGIPIGRPVANYRAYICDKSGAPVPVGVTGELYIGGPGVAVYLDEVGDRSAGKFIPDPYSSDEYARLYRTGDLCKCHDDGTIYFVGRRDAQIKLRGFRIEPEEVAYAIRQVPNVTDAAVIVSKGRGDTTGAQDNVLELPFERMNDADAETLLEAVEAMTDAEAAMILGRNGDSGKQ